MHIQCSYLSSCLLHNILYFNPHLYLRVNSLNLTFIHVFRFGVAAVQFDVVHTPISESLGVSLQMAQDARIAPTCEVAVVFVDPQFQTFVVHLPKEEAMEITQLYIFDFSRCVCVFH